jgi:P4 family phage/plasmid primase-like protien
MASTDDISTDVTISINRQFEEHYQHQLEVWKAKKEDKPPKKRKFNDNILRNVMRVLKSLTKLPKAVEMPCFITDDNQLDASKTGSYIAFLNGIVDLNRFPDDGYFEPITSNWFSLATIQYNFDMSADCPRWLAFLEECLEGDRERIAILQEFAGYILEPTTKYQKMLVLEGEGGNGKSVLMAALQAMIGKHNYSSIDLEQFGERFSLAQTHGRMANFSADQDEVQQLHEGRLKQFVAGDSITFDKKNEPPFEARATAKLIVSWNNRPRIRDRSKGIWRRIIIVPFNKIVDPSKRVYGMDNPQYWEAEAPGILLWALQGLTRLRERGFTQSIESDSSLASIQAESNPVSLFFDQWVEPSESSCVKSIDLYRAYTSWAIDRNFKPLNQTHFGREVQRHFPGADKKRKRNSSSRAYIYGGVRLREQFEVDRDTEDEISAQTGRHF